MQIITDDLAYRHLQQHLLQALAGDVRDTLREAAEGGASFDEAVKAITVTVAMIIDGTREMTHDGRPVQPMMMFGTTGDGGDVTDVLSGGGSPALHERANEVAEAVLAERGSPAGE
ncbi:MAG: hypothetical protein JWL60_946 [Gemmatimonadetes bacterium]|jgi:hypothetical protein|nr:hypothetical protein [Gemmatimonadota bacterium]